MALSPDPTLDWGQDTLPSLLPALSTPFVEPGDAPVDGGP